MNQYFLVDENGFPDYETSKVFGDKVEDGYILGWTTPFYKPRWNGDEWVEGATEEEIEEILRPVKDIFEERKEQTEMVLQMFARTLPDEEVLKVPLVFAEWQPDTDYEVGDVVRYGENLYRVRQPHRSQDDWPPPDVPALYLMIVPPEEVGEILPWEDRHKMGKELYMMGDQVTHQGYYWTSMVDNNHWEPTDANWAAWTKGDPYEE